MREETETGAGAEGMGKVRYAYANAGAGGGEVSRDSEEGAGNADSQEMAPEQRR